MNVIIHGAPMWYEVDGQAALNPHGYYAVPYFYGPLEDLDDEPVACGPQQLIVPTWDSNESIPF